MASICPHFLRGVCRYGPQCRQSHESPSAPVAVISPAPFISTQQLQAPDHWANRVLCKYFLEGRCIKGASCSFHHPDALGSTQKSWRQPAATTNDLVTSPHPLTQNNPQASFLRKPCKYFLKGVCKNGSACTFSHPDLPVTHSIVQPSLPSPQEPVTNFRLKVPCTFYNQGRCTKGQECAYLHSQGAGVGPNMRIVAPISKPDSQPINYSISLKEKLESPTPFLVPNSNHTPEDQANVANLTPPSTSHIRSLQHCEVHFGAGASVTQITTAFESSSVVVSNLPKSFTLSDMLNLTGPLDGLVAFTVFEATSTAILRFADCDQAVKAVRCLDDRLYAQTKLAARLSLRGAIESGSGTLLSRRVKLSWFAPSLVAWANYSSEGHAQKMVEKINAKTFDGHSLSASLRLPNPFRRGTYTWRSDPTIKIKGLPSETDSAHLQRFVQCSSITIGEPTYEKDIGIEKLRQLLSQNGSLESFDVLPPDKNKSKITAFAQFSNSDAAVKVAKEMHNTKHEFLGNSIVWVEQIHSIKYKLPRGLFLMVKHELDHLQSTHNVSKLLYHDRKVDPVYIRIYGSDPKLLGRLKVDVEQVLHGQPLTLEGGKDIWDEYFETDEGVEFIKRVNSQATIFVKCDARTRTFCLYGDCEYAKRLITQHLEQIVARRHVLSLGKESIRGLLSGGLKRLTDEIGSDKVVLDVIALTLTVRGDDNDVRKAHRAVAAINNQSTATLGASLEGVCPVCFCDPSNLIRLPCGHPYCLMCLQHLLRSHCQASNFSLVQCVTEIRMDGKSSCGTPIPYLTIRDLLSPAEEGMLFEASFLSYIRARPQEFRYCPTPDCKVIYRHCGDKNDDGVVLQCPSCLARICTHCNVEFHEGLTCAEHIDNANGGLEALQRWKDANGAKSCPRCNADLEKIDGCNHITCGVCKTHMCWVCMETFSNGPQVYDHMSRVHSSIGLDYLANLI